MSERIHYQLSHRHWSSEGACILRNEDGQQLLVLPVSFLRLGGVGDFAFALRQLQFCFEETSQCGLEDHAGAVVHGHEAIQAGQYTVRRQESAAPLSDQAKTSTDRSHSAESVDTQLIPRRGPRFKFKHRAPNIGDDHASTMSDSKRSSPNQSSFRVSIIARDFCCLITEEDYEACTPSHILPLSRPEYYEEVLGYDPGFLFEPSFGLLLRDDLHHAFDRGSIALYPQVQADGTQAYVVHVFNPEVATWREFHGKVITAHSRFRGRDFNFPNTDLLLFHYAQCSMKHMRGWSSM
ncbi:unnamed protein product [Jaminaea pallidilutea]